MTDRTYDIVTAPRRNSRHWEQGTITWAEVLAWVDDVPRHKESGNYLFGRLRETTVVHPGEPDECTGLHRRKVAVVSRSVLSLDVDYADPGVAEAFTLELMPYQALMYTTFSSRPDAPRLRINLPTDRDMSPDEYTACATVVMKRLGRQYFDMGSSQAERYMFKPAAEQPEWFESWVLDGEPIRVDELMAEFDPADLPKPPAVGRNKRDPYTLQGVVGAFNRVYDIDEAIDAYELPYVSAGAERWQLVGATSEAGVIQQGEGLYYSYHANDPAGLMTCTAFDLVRLHRFSDLDDEVSDKTPVNRRPSHQAMLELASVDPEVQAEATREAFADSPLAASPDAAATGHDWRVDLQRNPRTLKLVDTIDNWELIAAHDPVFEALYLNEMASQVEIDVDLPWRTVDSDGPSVTKADHHALEFHLEREYGLRPPAGMTEKLVRAKAGERRVHPVRDYLEGLVWDGVPRVEEALPGVVPTPYTRMVARKVLVAAVARIFEPGVKWDHTLVLYGTEGLGKTHWVERMSRDHSATLGQVGDKDTLMTMRGKWIMLSDEGYALSRPKAEQLKEFLTRRSDVFRTPYDIHITTHKRQSVIWSTTNNEVFLENQEGNRRFLIVHCEEQVDFEAMTDGYVGQVWAEAVQMYRDGEKLHLNRVESEMAAEYRELFTEEDAHVGLFQRYLDTLVPDDWDDMPPSQRAGHVSASQEDQMATGTRRQDTTCSMQMWVEALGNRMGDTTRVADFKRVTATLNRMPGWRRAGIRQVPLYGTQVVYERVPDTDTSTLEDVL